MKYKSSEYMGFMQSAKNQNIKNRKKEKVDNKAQEVFPRDISFWDEISSQKSEITLLNSNIEEESHFSFLQNPQQYKFLKTYTTSLFQQFYPTSLNSFIPKRKDTTQNKVRESTPRESKESKDVDASSGSFTAGFTQNPLYQVLSYWADSIAKMIEKKTDPNKDIVETSHTKMFSKDKISERKGFIANVIDTIYEDSYVGIYRVKGTSMYCVNMNGPYIWNCTYNSNYDQRKSIHIKKKGFPNLDDRSELEDIHIYDRKVESSGICAFDLSAGNLGILLHHAMFHFSPETSTVQIFHFDTKLPEIQIQSSDKKRIIASVGNEIVVGECYENDSTSLILNEDILPEFLQVEFSLGETGFPEIKSKEEGHRISKADLNNDETERYEKKYNKKMTEELHVNTTCQYVHPLTFWGDILRHVPHNASYSMFEPPSLNLYLRTFINWREQLSPSSIAGLGLLLCEELQKWIVQVKNIESREDVIRVLEERDRLTSLVFCMRKELHSLLSVFIKGDRIVQQHINDLIYTKMEREEINKIVKQHKRLYNVRLVEPDAYWGLQKKEFSTLDIK